MTVRTEAELITLIRSSLPDNITQEISEQDSRTFFLDLIESYDSELLSRTITPPTTGTLVTNIGTALADASNILPSDIDGIVVQVLDLYSVVFTPTADSSVIRAQSATALDDSKPPRSICPMHVREVYEALVVTMWDWLDGDVVTNQAPSISIAQIISGTDGVEISENFTASDPEEDALTVTASVGTVTDNGGGSYTWTYTPTLANDGLVVTFTVDDGTQQITEEPTLSISAANQAPTLGVSGTIAGSAGTQISEEFTASDPDGDSITVTATKGTVTDNGGGNYTWTYTPVIADDGTTVTFTADDGTAQTQVVSTLTISAANQPPVIGNELPATITVTDGVEETRAFTITDPDGDPISTTYNLGIVNNLGGGNFEWVYTGMTADNGTTVAITAHDGRGGTDQAIMTIVIDPNDAPVITQNSPDPVGPAGSPMFVDYTIADTDSPSLTVTSSIGTMIDLGGGLWQWQYTPVAGDDGVTVTVTADDDVNPAEQDTFDITISTFLTPSATISADLNPGNPAIVGVTLTERAEQLGSKITATELKIVGTTTQTIAGPIPPVVNMEAWQGETVQVSYKVTDSNAQEFTTPTVNVNVPTYTEELTVDPGQAVSSTNFHTVAAGVAALSNGGLLTIVSGTYTLQQNGEGTAFLLATSKQNCTVRGGGSTVLDGNYAAATSHNMVGVANSVNCCFDDIIFQNSRFAVFTSNNTQSLVLRGCTVRSAYNLGFYLINGSNNCKFIDCIGETMIIDGGGGSGTPFFINAQSGTVDGTVYWNCTAQNNARDGWGVDDLGAQNTLVRYCTSNSNGRQGFRTGTSGSIKIWDSTFSNNGASGIQIEAGALNEFSQDADIRRCQIFGNSTNAGEVGVWIDDTIRALIEDCEVYDNAVGLRANGNSGQGGHSEDAIFRFNRVRDNNGHGTIGDYMGIDINRSRNVCVYHNSFRNNNRVGGTANWGNLVSHRAAPGDLVGQIDFDITAKNNIFDIVAGSDADARHVILGDGLSSVKEIDYNLYGTPVPNPSSYRIAGNNYTFSNYQTAMSPSHEQNSQEVAVNINASTLAPNVGSPAINAASALTTISNISSNTLTVGNTDYFWLGDEIIFPNDERAIIQSKTDTQIVVDALPSGVSVNDGIRLYRPDGSANIGAMQ